MLSLSPSKSRGWVCGYPMTVRINLEVPHPPLTPQHTPQTPRNWTDLSVIHETNSSSKAQTLSHLTILNPTQRICSAPTLNQ